MNKNIKNLILSPFNWLYRINPVLETKLLWRLKMGYSLDLENPRTYNEKLNWLKLYYRNELMPICADKFTAREYITERGFGQFLPKLLWHGNKSEEIPFDNLPNQFVLKSTGGSGNNIIVKDKSKLNVKSAIKQAKAWLKEKYLVAYGEWPYMKTTPSLLVEELLSDGKNEVPADYKMFYFNGMGGVILTRVDLDRFSGHKCLLYDKDWNFMPGVRIKYDNGGKDLIEKPACYEQMQEVACKLAEPFPHCRVDFFVIGDRFYIGELTFFNGAGFDLVTPPEYNQKLGDAIVLPPKNNLIK